MPAFDVLAGRIPVLVTAPHAVRHKREGAWKCAEPATEAFARELHRSVGVHAIIKNDADSADPNSDEASPFRDAAVELVAAEMIVAGIDVHELSPKREQRVILGTGRGRNIQQRWEVRDIVVEEFAACGLEVVVDEVFPAMGQYRVSSDVARRAGIPYVQLEMNPSRIEEDLTAILGRIASRLSREVAR